MQWKPIDSNTGKATDRRGVIVCAKYPNGLTWSDPVFVWWDNYDNNWCSRWTHSFPPTHYIDIPHYPED
jgi:hypothetical protein